jgi:tetratricopeptide (TPR) repeat protein
MLGMAVTCMALLTLTVSASGADKLEVLIAPGDSYARKGDHDKAIDDYTEAIRIDPKDAGLYSIRAKAYRALGKRLSGKPPGDHFAQQGVKSAQLRILDCRAQVIGKPPLTSSLRLLCAIAHTSNPTPRYPELSGEEGLPDSL